MATKNAIFKAKINNVITELLFKTDAANVYVDENTTLADKLAAIITDIATKASTEELTTGLAGKAAKSHTHAQSEVTGLTEALAKLASNDSVAKAIDDLRQEMLGDTPVDAYNTFTELAAYITEHQEVSDALTAAVGNKADKATTLEGYGITDAYTKTEIDNTMKSKAGVSHTHVQADITGLADALKAKADKATTLAGYGITDAYTKTEVNTKVDGKADASHTHAQSEITGLTDALDGKADKATTLAGYGITDAYTKTETDTKISDAVSAASHTHDNKAVLDGIKAADVTNWNAKSKIYFSSTEPTGLTDQDLWVEIQ